MPNNQKFVFTALPAFHTADNAIKISVSAAVTIQLETGENGTLALFPDIRDWPEKIAGTNFKLNINNKDFPVKLVIKNLINGNDYRNLFTNKIKVRSYKKENQDLTLFPIKSYPVKHIAGFIKDTYQYVGFEKSDVLPDEDFFTSKWSGLKDISEWSIKEDLPDIPPQRPSSQHQAGYYTQNDFLAPSMLADSLDKLRHKKVVPFSEKRVPADDFAQLKNFHTSQTSKILPTVPDFEYHDILAILSGYPQLQRKFGLVLDFEIPDEAITALGNEGALRIIPDGIHFKAPATISCPLVEYEKTEKGFYLKPANGSAIDKGLLKINNNPEFMVVQFDTDGAALKLCNQADNLVLSRARHLSLLSEARKKRSFNNQEEHENYNQRNEGLPTLRSSGIGLVRNGHAGVLFNKFERSKNLYDIVFPRSSSVLPDTRDTVTFLYPAESLFADDLVQGYRMDIYDHTFRAAHPEKEDKDAWFSLHRRTDTYSYAPAGNATKISLGINEEDEGFIQISAAQETSGDKALAVGEVIARWEGWSLSVRKPGIAINNPAPGKEAVNTEAAEKKKYLLPDFVEFRLEANSKIVKGSLPRLRFGGKYKIKIRVVDLAGNSLRRDYEPENSNDTVINDIVYRRYDPTPTPVIKYASEIKDGESLERMVIRSNSKFSAEEYESSVNDRMRFLPVATRHFQAPRTTQFMAELHDMFEGIGNGKKNKQDTDYKNITTFNGKEEKDFSNYQTPDGITDEPQSFEEAGRFVYPDVKNLPLTYLADPMAAGVVFFLDNNSDAIPGWKKGEAKYCSFYSDEAITENTAKPISKEEWLVPKSFRIQLKEGKQGSTWDMAERKLIVYLDKGVTVTLNYASFWRPQDIREKSGLYQILGNKTGGFADPNKMSITLGNAQKGKHWMISPWRTLTLVHAIQQPLDPPQISRLQASRKENDTTASLNTTISVHGRSTDKVSIEAFWNEHMDDFADHDPKISNVSAHVVSIPVDYFNERIYGNAATSNVPEKKGGVILHEFNDTKHRWITYKPVATSRYREYFTAILKKNPDTLSVKSDGPLFTDNTMVDKFNSANNGKVNILSSARPAVPLVDYILPSFNWARKPTFSDGGNTETHFRTGNIRVYLKRPWFSSGEGERLGVVFCMGEINPDLAQHYTLWGKDPIYNGGELNNKNAPTPDDFTFPFSADKDVVSLIPDRKGAPEKVIVFAYNGVFDADRQLYYADIPVNCYKAYFPFIKLALCRYQRHSLRDNAKGTDLCISGIVQTDWIQIVPPRTVTVTTDTLEKNKLTVSVRGTSPVMQTALTANAAAPLIKSRIKIIIEESSFPKTDEAFVRIKTKQISNVAWEKQFDISAKEVVNDEFQFMETVVIDEKFKRQPYRIVIEEYELLKADPIRSQGKTTMPSMLPQQQPAIKERLVFMDVFEVNG